MRVFSGTERWNMIWHNHPSPPGFQSPSLPTTVDATKTAFISKYGFCEDRSFKRSRTQEYVPVQQGRCGWNLTLGSDGAPACEDISFWAEPTRSSQSEHFSGKGKTEQDITQNPVQSIKSRKAFCLWLHYAKSCGWFFPLTFSGQWWSFPGRADQHLCRSCM